MASTIQFENLKPPALNQAVAEVHIEDLHLDLHQQLRMVGLTFGVEPTTVTLGWAATRDTTVVRRGQAWPLGGLVLHFLEVSRFEVAFTSDQPGALEYFELRNDPEPTLIFFFEGGTLRVSPRVCRAELLLQEEDEEDIGLVQ